MSRFVVRIGAELKVFSRYEDIPEVIDHVIEFRPDVPEPPHTEDQHAALAAWNGKLHELLKRERRCRP